MELTAKGGSMVVDFLPLKDWDNTPIDTHFLKVLSLFKFYKTYDNSLFSSLISSLCGCLNFNL